MESVFRALLEIETNFFEIRIVSTIVRLHDPVNVLNLTIASGKDVGFYHLVKLFSKKRYDFGFKVVNIVPG